MLSFLFPFSFDPPVFLGWRVMVGSCFVFYNFFFAFPYFMGWGSLSYMFGCDYLSCGLILLSFWVCVLMIMASEPILRSFYYPFFYFLLFCWLFFCFELLGEWICFLLAFLWK